MIGIAVAIARAESGSKFCAPRFARPIQPGSAGRTGIVKQALYSTSKHDGRWPNYWEVNPRSLLLEMSLPETAETSKTPQGTASAG